MHILKSVGVMSTAKILGLLYGLLGLIFVPFFLLLGGLGALIGQGNTPFNGIFFFVYAILIPVLYGVLGFIFGAVGAVLYNVIAKWVGGFELELESLPEGPVAPYPVVPPATPPI